MPLPSTMTPIATTTLASNTTEISFTNIPNIYTDLVLVLNGGKKDNVTNTINVRVNSDSGTNYSTTRLYSGSGTVYSDRFSSNSNMYTQTIVHNAKDSTALFHFLNYSNTTTFKTMLNRMASASIVDGGAATSVSLWRSTSAITSIQLQLDFGSTNQFLSGTSATLYGVKAA